MLALYNYSMNRADIIADIIVSEGGSKYTNRPNDAGGPTKYGITIPALSDFLGHQVTWEEIYHLNDASANAFYNWLFERYKADRMPESMQHCFFDTVVLHGFGGASTLLQKALVKLGQPIRVDGDAGKKTFEAVKCVSPDILKEYFLSEREAYYHQRVIDRPADEENLQGWLNRLNRLRD